MSPPLRQFERAGLQVADKTVSAYQVTCCQCGVGASMMVNNHSGVLSAEIIINYFRRKGWHIDKTPNHDLCPDHERRRVVQLHAPKEEVVKKEPQSREDSLIGTINGCLRGLEKALSEYAELPETKRNDEVITLIEAFRERVWGAPEPAAAVGRPPHPLADQPIAPDDDENDEERRYGRWSDEEIAFIRNNAHLGGKKIAKALHRSVGSVYQKAFTSEIKISGGERESSWTDAEEETVRRNLGVLTNGQISRLVGRSPDAVRGLMLRKGWTRD